MKDGVKHDSVITIDCNYLMPKFAAAYLVVEGDRAAYIDNNTSRATPLLMQALDARGLQPEQVLYAIVTHVHLDHAGGTSALLRECPNAVAVAHPRAARHLVKPSRLVAAVKSIYGESAFDELYGQIDPIDADRVRTVEDGETLRFGGRTFTFLHTLGHARHHMCIHDSGSNGVFTGDALGLAYPALQRGSKPFVICSSSPADFDPAEARRSVARIVATGADRVYLTHFGEVTPVDDAADQVRWSIDSMEAIINDAVAAGLTDDKLDRFCTEHVRASFIEQAANCGFSLTEADWQALATDVTLNASGIAYAASRAQCDHSRLNSETAQ